MALIPAFDMGWVVLTHMFGVWGLILSFPLIVLVEAIVFRKMLLSSASFWHVLRTAFVVNVASGLVGLGWQLLVEPDYISALGDSIGGPAGTDYYTAPTAARITLLLVIMLVYWAISVIVESLVLRKVERQSSTGRVWWSSLVANLASYAGLFTAVAIYLL